MKTIGIKLADGSFYPVLQEGMPSEKKLNLTTAHNNQTKVNVDLYRSASCSMEDAEYVDSLQIDNLVEHPNGEPDLSFSVAIDENNELSAKIVDTETGRQSNSTITLVSRTMEERLVTDEYDISESDDSDKGSKTGAKAAGAAVAGVGLLAAAEALRKRENETTQMEFTPAGDDEFKDDVEEIPEEESSAPVDSENEEDTEDEAEPEQNALSILLQTNDEAPETPQASFEDSVTEPVEMPVEETTVEEPEEASEPDFTNFDLDLPDTFDEKPEEDAVIVNEEPVEEVAEEPASEPNIFDDSADETVTVDDVQTDSNNQPETELPDMDFDIPEEDTTIQDNADVTIPDDSDATITDDEADQFSMDDLDTSDTSFDIPEDTTENEKLDDDFFDIPDEPAPAAGGISFTGLYDKDDLNESSSFDEEEEEVSKKTKAPVIICIICAIICIIATILVLLIKHNIIGKKNVEETPIEKTFVPEPSPAPVVEPEPEPPAPAPSPAPVPEAKEDEIVVIEKAEEVVPEQPPVAAEKPKDITYKIKWGDTLWDIADTYYKNPWRYKYIARWNGIKNPDYIISGTYITIPAE